ncbi:MAG: hypothetical protein JSW45_11195 [Thiotrichales bacterium]|nr:MAG: hypothetical protein JSW45_11195 [Thiotrichales bacterium]
MGTFWKPGIIGRSINLLLIGVILFTTLMPAHYHLHHIHDTDGETHDHAIDLHFVTTNTDQSHHDEETSIFAATPDVIVKKINSDITPFVLLTVLLVLLAVLYRVSMLHEHGNASHRPHHPYFTPPLRAPPVI